MIGILCKANDLTAEEVMDWLLSYGQKSKKIREEDLIEEIHFALHLSNNQPLSIQFDEQTNASKIDFLWQRKWTSDQIPTHNQEDTQREVSHNLNQEFVAIRDFLLKSFKDSKKLLGFCSTLSQNKLYQLTAAKNVGFAIPETFVVNRLPKEVTQNSSNFITKPIQRPLIINHMDGIYTNYTSLLKKPSSGEKVFPSLIQRKIDKEYEIRVFYLSGKSYSMAILSQMHEKSAIDFRQYEQETPTRNLPYQIPHEVEQKINALMEILDLEMGSIDLIKSKSGEFVFLEVNPFGQFGMVSKPCNYYLEKKIAQHLTNQVNE